MPRHFFHTIDGALDIDEEGTDFPDLGAARVARSAMRAMPVGQSRCRMGWPGFPGAGGGRGGEVVVTIVTSAIDTAVDIRRAASG